MSRFGSAANGRIIIACWDGNVTDYTCVYSGVPTADPPVVGLKARGWPGVTGVFATSVAAGAPNDLNAAQATELGTFAGWDVVVHGNEPGDDYSGMTYGQAYTNADTALSYLATLRVRGGSVIAPSGGVSETTWGALRALWSSTGRPAYVVWETATEYLQWPRGWPTGQAGQYWDIDWAPCADQRTWETQVKAKLDLVTGNPRQVVVASIHRVVASDAVGTQISYARLAQVESYIAGLNATISTVTQLLDYVGVS
jgi:hypothetical protein